MRNFSSVANATVFVAAGCWGAAAAADPLTISTAQTTPVATATAANNSPGDITIATGGSITVATGTAATINSANVLTSGGAITNTGTTGAIGVLINSPGPLTFTNNSAITLSGTAGSGDIGLSLTGPGTTGSILFGTTGSLSVAGDNAIGVALAAPFTGPVSLRTVTASGAASTAISLTGALTGSLRFAGTVTAQGVGSTGVVIAAPVSGSVTNAGSVSVGTVRGLDASGVIVAGNLGVAGVRISRGIGQGFVNDRYYIDSTGAVVPPASVDTTVDSLVIGTITSTGSAPAVWIGPDAANQPVVLGAFGTGADAFGFVNRGTISTNIADAGLASVAVRIGGGPGATTTLTGGIANQAAASIVANSLDARATAVDLLSGAIVPQLVNQGAIGAATTATASTGTTPVGPGGMAVGVMVEPGAALGSIVNSGTIAASAVGKNSAATAVYDQQGSIATITNTSTGVIAATAPGTGGATRAIDLSAGAGAVTFVNGGTITGDVVLGQGATTVQLIGGTISGALSFGNSPANLLALSGATTFSGALLTAAPIALSLADTSRLSLVGLVSPGRTVTSISATGASTLVVPVLASGVPLTVTGAASFTGSSTVSVALQSLALTQNVTLISANGGITTDHLATLVDASSAPYLFTATTPVLTPTTLSIGLTRKSAADIGLTGAQANLYDASIPALANSPVESAAIANLSTQAAVAGAYRQITPPSYGRAQFRVAQQVADSGFGAAADRLAILTDRAHPAKTDDAYGIGLWAQEYGDFNRQTGPQEGSFSTSALGIAGGIDTTRFAHTVIGVGFVSNFASIHHDAIGTESGFTVPSTTSGVEPYVAFQFKPVFVEATAIFAHVGYSASRTLAIGGLTRTVTSNWSASQYGAAINVGARLAFGHFRVTPSNSLSWTQLQQNAYTEQGGGAFDLAVAKQTDSATSDTVKLALAFLRPLGDGVLKLEVHGAYTKQLNLKPTETVAQFVSGAGAISLPGDTVRSDEKSYGLDLGYTQDAMAIRGGYDRREATGFRDQSVAVVATLGF